MEVVGEFNVRGGIATNVTAVYEKRRGSRPGLH